MDYNPKRGFVCEKHFLESDYVLNVHGNKVLKSKAVPSVFDFPIYLQKKTGNRRILKRVRGNKFDGFELVRLISKFIFYRVW